MASNNSLLVRRLYQSLLKTANPFTVGTNSSGVNSNRSPVTLTCLLHRSGTEDESWVEFLRGISSGPKDEIGMVSSEERERSLFRNLLREVVAGSSSSGIRHMQFPSHVDTDRLRQVIRREFRDTNSTFDLVVRRNVAFKALRELNKKLAFASKLDSTRRRHPQQPACHVTPLPLHPPKSYLRPGAYLLAHPNMTGYFRRSVICILDHRDEGTDDSETNNSGRSYGTYGLIVNRVSVSPQSGKTLTLQEVLRPLPLTLKKAFGASPVKEGGPVQLALQMLHLATSEQEEESRIGGCVLSPILANDEESLAAETDRAVYYKGDILNAASAVSLGKLDCEDISFFVGASCWSVGQMEKEIELGFWLPCSGPTSIAQSGICEHDYTVKGEPRPEADLWLSMMSSCGEEEAKLAHLLYRDDGRDKNGAACDDF
jgi:putative AlgH/UPF0301 family transcriptional regulator